MAGVLENTIAPVDVRKSEVAIGFAEKVFVEVAVSKVLRKILRVADKGILYLTAVHYMSQPLIGGFGKAFGEVTPFGQGPTYMQAVKDGAKGIPAVFFAQYVVNVSLKGLHVPGISVKDMFITAAAKTLTRPLMAFLGPQLGTQIKASMDIADEFVVGQARQSTIPQLI